MHINLSADSSIKDHTELKKKTTFLCPKIGVKCMFQHNIQKMACARLTNYCPILVFATLYLTVSFVFSRK